MVLAIRTIDQRGAQRVLLIPGAEHRAAAVLREHRARRALVVCAPGRRDGAERVSAALGSRSVGILDTAVQHVPAAVARAGADLASERGADWVVAHGGGSAIGLAKAIALETRARIVAIPTTYSGSEVTGIWGITDGDRKRTGRDPIVRPAAILYDPELLVGLRFAVARASLLNAAAHAVEALWSPDANAERVDGATRAIRALVTAARALHRDPGDVAAAAEGLYGAWLAGEALESAAMGVHHKLCHVLGGSFGLPHADTHAVVLPYAVAFNARWAPDAIAALSATLDTPDPATALHALGAELGVPRSLAELGLSASDLDRAAEIAASTPYPNPRPIDAGSLRALLGAAHAGTPPSLAESR